MATYFEVLSDGERDDLDRITSALSAALATPVAVA
jgi:hypothetical protein